MGFSAYSLDYKLFIKRISTTKVPLLSISNAKVRQKNDIPKGLIRAYPTRQSSYSSFLSNIILYSSDTYSMYNIIRKWDAKRLFQNYGKRFSAIVMKIFRSE